MKKIILFIIGIILFIILVPIICNMLIGEKNEIPKVADEILVYVTSEDKVEKMSVNQYIKEVVSAEMPVEFSKEALKAQAVAARSYMMAKMANGEYPEHKGADVCTDHTHCAAWISEENRKKLWNTEKNEEYWKKISEAVEETDGEIMICDGKAVNAVFHSTSSGKTESASDVWGGKVAYLQSVDSPGEELSPKFLDEKQMPISEYCAKILENYPEADTNAPFFEIESRSNAGGVISVRVCGVSMKGTEFRKVFGLRSTNIEFSQTGENVIIKTKGNGHGVGMSQYGANYMAKQGSDYQEILTHYYTGVELKKGS